MPAGEMRRKDREIGAADSEAILDRALVGRIGTVGPDGMPYVVPMNYCYDSGSRTIYLHCATTGHLLDNLAHSPLACFEVDEPGPVLHLGGHPCDTSQVYSSVICFGRARVLVHPREKEHALRLFARKYVDRLAPGLPYDQTLKTIGSTAVIALHVDSMTGKQRRQP